jgi:hypothetical protein
MTIEKLIELLIAASRHATLTNNPGSSAPPAELDPVLSGRQRKHRNAKHRNRSHYHDTEIENRK